MTEPSRTESPPESTPGSPPTSPNDQPPVLITGGAGYIGSHTAKRLLDAGRSVVLLDDLSRGNRAAVDRLAQACPGRVEFVHADIADARAVDDALARHAVRDVLHFAALAYVGESVREPLPYYRINTGGTAALLERCLAAGVERFVLSSSCATYGEPDSSRIPISENCPQAPVNPYGRSKLFAEQAVIDAAATVGDRDFSYALLRYFNVAGCDRSGLLGEDHDPETHLIPIVLQAAAGRRERVEVFGADYDTPDGTCVRDYIHVEDLADAHAVVLGVLGGGDARAYNLGNAAGYSVREVIAAAARVTGRAVDAVDKPRRPGDPPVLVADPSRIRDELGWSARTTELDEIVRSAWAWFEANPAGYRG